MNSIDPKLTKLIKSMVSAMNSSFQFQMSIFKLALIANPSMSEAEKKNFIKTAESLESVHKLLTRQSEQILPS